jgi:hypothetical protein
MTGNAEYVRSYALRETIDLKTEFVCFGSSHDRLERPS